MAKNITATFSNGFEDTYKGTRDVKAAWMITHKETGKVLLSGHSLDRATAEKTAKNNVQYVGKSQLPHFIIPRSHMDLHNGWAQHLAGELEKYGVEVKNKTRHGLMAAARAANKERKSQQQASVVIEVIDL